MQTDYDDKVTGLHLRTFPSGRKVYYLYYRTKTGQQRRPKIGDDIIGIAKARSIAKDMLAKVAAGGDPTAEAKAARAAPTVAELCERYLADHASKKKPRSQAEDEAQINNYVLPMLGSKKVWDVKAEDVERIRSRLTSKPIRFNRLHALLSKIFTLAEKWGFREVGSNPCRHIQRYKENKRRRYLRQAEAPVIAKLLNEAEVTHPREVLFIYLLILSGARPDEIERARPEWIERKNGGGILHLPDSKTGQRAVYLPPAAMNLIDQVKGDITVTGVAKPRYFWEKMRTAAGCPDLRLYDLRHTFASAALAAGYSLEQIGELLGHSSTQTTKRYAHLMTHVAQKAAADTGRVIQGMLDAPSQLVQTDEHLGDVLPKHPAAEPEGQD